MKFNIAVLPLLAALTLSTFSTASLAANEISLTGRYEFRTDVQSLEMLGDLVCFYPETASARRLPRAADDKRLAWLCFKNEAVSRKLLSIPEKSREKNCGISGEATVKIKDYVAFKGEGDGFDTATLMAVTQKSARKNLACQ